MGQEPYQYILLTTLETYLDTKQWKKKMTTSFNSMHCTFTIEMSQIWL